jgi:hypothetical protein
LNEARTSGVHDAETKKGAEPKARGRHCHFVLLPKIFAISDRILVARGGRIVEEVPALQASEEKTMCG